LKRIYGVLSDLVPHGLPDDLPLLLLLLVLLVPLPLRVLDGLLPAFVYTYVSGIFVFPPKKVFFKRTIYKIVRNPFIHGFRGINYTN
jgi:hypothetical protein